MTNDNVIRLPSRDGSLPPDDVLQDALNAKMTSVIVIGYDANGLEYFASSDPDGGNVNWLLDRMKKKLLEVPERLVGRL